MPQKMAHDMPLAISPDSTLYVFSTETTLSFLDSEGRTLYTASTPGHVKSALFHPAKYEILLNVDDMYHIVFDLATKEFVAATAVKSSKALLLDMFFRL